MIVDDDPFARKLMRDSLNLSGEQYDIFETEKGRLALELMAVERPDLVLLDINMPEVGGIPVCTEIKRNPATAQVRIIIVSAHSGSDFVADCLSAGADDYMSKPFQPGDLARRVQRLLTDPVAA
jgi:two-component system sensor histidine kinase/response regulator